MIDVKDIVWARGKAIRKGWCGKPSHRVTSEKRGSEGENEIFLQEGGRRGKAFQEIITTEVGKGLECSRNRIEVMVSGN